MPDFGNSGLRKYEDRFFVAGIGRVSFSASFHDLAALSRISEEQIAGTVRTSAAGLRDRIRANAPYRFGTLQSGIIVAPGREKSSRAGKVVNDIVFDRGMNDSFVKISRAGKRYYYPASQEYGFRIGRTRRKPGLYYMRNTAAAYYAEHEQNVSEGIMEILEEI